MGLLEPFSHQRFSFNALFVADPFFSLWPAIAFVVLLVLKRTDKTRRWWWRFGVLGSAIYLLYCSLNKMEVSRDVHSSLAKQGVHYNRYFTTPTPLNNWLWYVVVKDTSGYYVGFHSMFDRQNKKLDLHYFPRNDSLLAPVKGYEELQHLLRFSQGYYTVEKWHDTLVFNDLRFGQMIGWYDPHQKFVFHYYLGLADKDNRLVVQRGRFAKWNWQTTQSLLHRIAGQ
jgi:inner membrane protein